MRRYQAAAPETLRIERLDGLTLVYHRASGLTHLLAAPAPELLALLVEAPLSRAELLAELVERYDLADPDGALDARLGELVDAGLVRSA